MAFVIRDRVKEGTTTVGTGDIALLGAPVTFNNFSAYLTTGDTTYYAVVHTVSGVDEWEVGLGTYNATTNTIERTAVLSGTNGTNPVNFSEGTKNVFMTYPADKALYYDADGNVTFGANAEVAGDLVLGGYIDLNVYSTEPAHKEGRIFYHNEYGALSVYNEQSGVTLQVGQEEWVRVYNGTGSTILDGTPVYPAGIQGEAQSVAPANATTGQKARVLGVATHDIPTGTYGYATVRGLVSGIDTSGLMPGMPVYLGVDGSLTNASPTYPYYPTQIGGCIVSDATNGYIYVSPKYNTYNQLRVTGNQHIDGNLQIDGDLTITGTQSVVSQASLSVDDSFIYMNSGNTIGDANTAFSGTGLDDATFTGHYEGVTTQTFYVRIDGVGTGTGGVDTFEWSLDNFTTTQATGVDCSTAGTALVDGISIKFNAATGHTSGDTWSGSASPVNVDSGTFSNRNTGETGVGYTHMGWFYDVSTNKFTFLEAYDPEPDGTIDLGHASVVYATIKAGTFEGAVLGNVTGNVNGTVTGALVGDSSGTHTGPVVGNVTGNADTATKLATARTVQLSGDVTGSATFDGSANINIIATVGDDSHAHVIANVDGLQAALDAKADDATTITAGTGLTGGGDLSVNRTLALDTTYTDGRYVNATGDTMTGDLTVPNLVTAGLVDGRDVSVDGAKLDGIEAGATADQTASEILAAITTVDGADSGLDADLLDGQQGSYYTGYTDTAVASAVPSGVIAMWSGATTAIPAGWVICDGLNGTPDLRDRFVMGAGSTYAVGATGGTAAITSVPAHTHTGTTASGGGHTHTGTSDAGGAHTHTATNATGGAHTHTASTGASGAHTHNASTGNSGNHTHTGTTGNSGNHTHTGNTSNTGAHTHTGNTSGTGAHNHSVGSNSSGDGVVRGIAASYSPRGVGSIPYGAAVNYYNTFYDGAAVIASNGNHSHSFTTASAGAHSHSFTTAGGGDHSHNFTSAAGGDHSHTVTVADATNHTHTVTVDSGGGHTHTITVANADNHTHTFTTATGGAHTHTFTTGSTGDASVSVLNPYYALAYIMKV